MRIPNHRRRAVLVAAALGAIGVSVWSSTQYHSLEASSHREAPLIADDPLADNTDVYAFRSPTDSTRVVLIANYVPFELPHGGPNYYSFGEKIRYEVHVKNNPATPGDDITYRFIFAQTNADPTTFFNIRLGRQNLKTTYRCEKKVGTGAFATIVTNGVVPPNNIGPRSINSPVGLSTPNYETLRTNAIATATGGGNEQVYCGPADDPFFADLGAIFDLAGLRPNATPRDGLARRNVHSICLSVPIATLQKTGRAVSTATSILDSDFIIGVWASASRPTMRTLSTTGTDPTDNGPYVQVSRLGMPLTNEVINPIGTKDRWVSRTPYTEDAATENYLTNPELALYMDTAFFAAAVPAFAPLRIQRRALPTVAPPGLDFGNTHDGLFPLKGSPLLNGTALADAAFGNYLLRNNKPRSVDILPLFHTGVPNLPPYQLATGKGGNPLAVGKPFINNFLAVQGSTIFGGDMLRLNMAVPATPRTSPAFSNMGLLAAAALGLTNPRYNTSAALQRIPNMDGFPNGRRLEDAVDKIELQAVAGVVLAAIGVPYEDYTGGPSPVTARLGRVLAFTSGVERNDTTIRTAFPFVQTPWRGTGRAGGFPALPAIVTGLGNEAGALGMATPELMMQNFPNPCTDRTTFRYHLVQAGRVTLTVYDLTGRRVAMPLKDAARAAGSYDQLWTGIDLRPGIYTAVLDVNGRRQTVKLQRQ